MFLIVSCTIGGMEAENRKRLGQAVVARRIELGMRTTKALSEEASLTPRMLGDLENGRRDNFSGGTKAQIERALQWKPGSIDATLAGGDPTPILGGIVLPEPEGHSLSDSYAGQGMRPGSLAASVVMSTRERQMLAKVRTKLVDGSALSTDEHLLLTRFVEEEELRTLHARIDWLPRAEQLEVSALVNDLHMGIENRRIADGPGRLVPDYALPNPLPRDGITPDELDEQGDEYALSGDQTSKPDAPPEVDEIKEDESLADKVKKRPRRSLTGVKGAKNPRVDPSEDDEHFPDLAGGEVV